VSPAVVPPYEKSVFINCPFDDLFAPLFHAIVLTVAARGFTPRCARETEGQAETRIARIAKGLLGSKYSIHDLSRFQGEGAENLARFNMPLELGMALGVTYLSQLEQRTSNQTHTWMALVPGNFVHQKFISDLAGYDAPDHDQKPDTIIKRVAAWMSLQPDFSPATPSAKTIFEAYPRFCEALEKSKTDNLGVLTWGDISRNAEIVIATMPV
jgi:hypothetical protein